VIFKLSISLKKIGSLDLHYLAVVCSKMCTDTPLVPARLPPPICLVIPARHPPRACLRRRTGQPSAAPYNHAILSSARVSGSHWQSMRHTAWRAREEFLACGAVWRLKCLHDYYLRAHCPKRTTARHLEGGKQEVAKSSISREPILLSKSKVYKIVAFSGAIFKN
jgi:hypothetical protein